MNSFLATYVSRYSDYNGYWVFGLLVESSAGLDVDLMSGPPVERPRSAQEGACHLARARFWGQVDKHGFPKSWIRAATLNIIRLGDPREEVWPGRIEQEQREYLRLGYDVAFRVTATSDLGRTFRAEVKTFVAIHDPDLELRRHPEDWGAAASDPSGPHLGRG